MGSSVIIRTPMPSAEEVADSLGLSQERRQFLKELASAANRERPRTAGAAQRPKAGKKRALKKAA